MVTDKTKEVRKMKVNNNQAPQGPTCLSWYWTMILYLSTAMVMMVKEDYAGKVFTENSCAIINLEI
jgi:hypothetical protein